MHGVSGETAGSENARPTEGSAVVGLQWGDEGKGKVADMLASQHDVVVRYNGGANAGNTIVVDGQRHALHLVPTGILHPGVSTVVGHGVVIDPAVLLSEIETLQSRGVDVSGLRVSSRAHVVMPYHKDEDAARESALACGAADGSGSGGSIGTTRRGIGPAYAEKAHRATAVRICDLLRPEALREKLGMVCRFKSRSMPGVSPVDSAVGAYDAGAIAAAYIEYGKRLAPYVCDTVRFVHEAFDRGDRVLFTGANATLLDIDHGAYPYVTSSNGSSLGISAGTGVPPSRIGSVLGVLKAYGTRVGGGPFPTELHGATADRIRHRGREYGTTTGRPRRIGWLDLVALRYAVRLNGCAGLAVTLLDVLSGLDALQICTAYRLADGSTTGWFCADASELESVSPVFESLPGFSEDITAARSVDELPPAAVGYLKRIEASVGAPVRYISVGPDRAQAIDVGAGGLAAASRF